MHGSLVDVSCVVRAVMHSIVGIARVEQLHLPPPHRPCPGPTKSGKASPGGDV